MGEAEKRFGKNLKALRTKLGLSQGELAKACETTQQSVARWEKGLATPSFSVIHDLALSFGVTTRDLLDIDGSDSKPRTSTYHVLLNEKIDGFWGHIGLALFGVARPLWFPITAREAERVENLLLNWERREIGEWVVVGTMANRLLLFKPTQLKRVWLKDDAAEVPEWNMDRPDYQGLEPEMYSALYAFCVEPDDFKTNYSKKFQDLVFDCIKEREITPEALLEELVETRLYFSDGEITNINPEPTNLYNLVDELETNLGGDFVSIEATEGCPCYYPTKSLVLVDASWIEYETGYARITEEEEQVEERQEAKSKTPSGLNGGIEPNDGSSKPL